MPEFNIRSDSVNVEEIMEQIRARIREKRGVDYTEQQLRELAAVKLEKLIDPRVRSDLVEQFRRRRPAIYEPLVLPELPEHAIEPLPQPAHMTAYMPEYPSPYVPAEIPETLMYTFEADTIYETHRAPLRWIRRLLNPILKLFFNPNPIVQALHWQGNLNKILADRDHQTMERDSQLVERDKQIVERDRQLVARDQQIIEQIFHRDQQLVETHRLIAERDHLIIERDNVREKQRVERREMDALYYEVIHNLVFELSRLGVENKNLQMRVESIASRLEFNERRARALESVVAYQSPDDARPEPEPAARTESTPMSQSAPTSAPQAQTSPAGSGQTQAAEGPGQRSRRRRRRRGRRGGASAAAMMGGASTPSGSTPVATSTDAGAQNNFHPSEPHTEAPSTDSRPDGPPSEPDDSDLDDQ